MISTLNIGVKDVGSRPLVLCRVFRATRTCCITIITCSNPSTSSTLAYYSNVVCSSSSCWLVYSPSKRFKFLVRHMEVKWPFPPHLKHSISWLYLLDPSTSFLLKLKSFVINFVAFGCFFGCYMVKFALFIENSPNWNPKCLVDVLRVKWFVKV